MRITDEQKQKAFEYVMGQYDQSFEGDEEALDNVDEETRGAIAYALYLGIGRDRRRQIYQQTVELLLAFYQKAEDYEILFTTIYDLLRELDTDQLRLLSIRIEIMAKELAVKEESAGN